MRSFATSTKSSSVDPTPRLTPHWLAAFSLESRNSSGKESGLAMGTWACSLCWSLSRFYPSRQEVSKWSHKREARRMRMAINWKSVGWISSTLVAAALAVHAASLGAQRDRQARLRQARGADTLLPLATGFGFVNGPVDPTLHCVPMPAGISVARQSTSKAWMDSKFHGDADWTVISNQMAPGDDIYAYSNISHPAPGVTSLAGAGGGYIVLRGWCLVGRFHTWVE